MKCGELTQIHTYICILFTHIYIYNMYCICICSKESLRKTSTLIATSARHSLMFSGVYSTSAKATWNCNRWKATDSIKCCQHLTVQPQRGGSAGLIETVWWSCKTGLNVVGCILRQSKVRLRIELMLLWKAGDVSRDSTKASDMKLWNIDIYYVYTYIREGNCQRKNLCSINWRQKC